MSVAMLPCAPCTFDTAQVGKTFDVPVPLVGGAAWQADWQLPQFTGVWLVEFRSASRGQSGVIVNPMTYGLSVSPVGRPTFDITNSSFATVPGNGASFHLTQLQRIGMPPIGADTITIYGWPVYAHDKSWLTFQSDILPIGIGATVAITPFIPNGAAFAKLISPAGLGVGSFVRLQFFANTVLIDEILAPIQSPGDGFFPISPQADTVAILNDSGVAFTAGLLYRILI